MTIKLLNKKLEEKCPLNDDGKSMEELNRYHGIPIIKQITATKVVVFSGGKKSICVNFSEEIIICLMRS